MKIESGIPGVIVIEGHVQGLANTRALGREGIPVMVLSEHDCLAHYSRYCRKFFKCPGYLSTEFIDFLIDLASTENINGWILLPSNDHAVFNISANIEKLKNHFKIISEKPDVLDLVYNKELFIKICQAADIPVPLSWFPVKPEDIISSDYRYPLLIKGKNGLTFYKRFGKKAFLADSPDRLMKTMALIREKALVSEVYFQDLLPIEKNKTVSFTAFAIEGEIRSYWMGKKVREHPIQFGTATFSRSANFMELVPLAEILLKNLSFTGVCEIEFLLDPRENKFKLIEMNARTWLWVDMAIKSGINYPLMIYNYLNRIEADYPKMSDMELEWIHYLTDIPYSLLGIIKGKYSINEIAKSYLKFPKPAVFDFSDILPSFAEIALLPFLILRR